MSSSEKTSGVAEGEKMDTSSFAEENKDKAGEQPEVSNMRATPSQVNQAENTPSDNRTHVDKSEPKTKRTKQNTESGKGTKGLRAEKLMKCPKCKAKIAPPSVTFCKQKDDQYEFSIGLQQDSGDIHTDKLDWTNKAAVKNATKQCPECKESFTVKHSVVSRTKRMGGFDIEFSIDIPKGDKVEGMEQDDMEDSSSENSTGGTQPENGNCDGRMEQENPTGPNTDIPIWRRFLNRTESRKSSSRKPEQSNQTTNSEGSSFFSRLPAVFQSPAPVVKVYCTPTSDTFGANAAIMKKLENNLKSSVQLEETTRKNCSIIIIFCPVSRSFESEAKLAMEKEVSSSGKPVILVLMHHTRDPDYSTAGCDASEVLKNVFHVHVFYHETVKGLLTCKQNDTAIKDIERKLQTYQQ